jgi:hypothetical protein
MFISKNHPTHTSSLQTETQFKVHLPASMRSKAAPVMSDGDFAEKIRDLARRDAVAGKFQSHDINSEFYNLERSYVAPYSPDRVGMISSAMKGMAGKLRTMAREFPEIKDLIDLLLGGKEIPQQSRYLMSMGHDLVLFDLRDENGKLLASLSTSGWCVFPTDAENARSAEFISIYNKAWDVARAEIKAESGTSASGNISAMLANRLSPNIPRASAANAQVPQGQVQQQVADRYETLMVTE